MAYDIVATGKNVMNEADSTQLSDLPPEINRNFGEDGQNIVDLLRRSNGFPGCAEEDIVGRTGLKITAVRKILYKLRDINLVEESSQEKEDGSLTFYWLLRPNQPSTYIASERRLKLEQLLARLSFERSHIFLFCERDDARMTYEEVMQGQTVCPVCHGPLQSFENANIIQSLEAQIKDLQPSLPPLHTREARKSSHRRGGKRKHQ